MTIREIAAIAGVSPAAVSLVINNKKGVSAETRRHIQSIMEECGYVPAPVRRKADRFRLMILKFRAHGIALEKIRALPRPSSTGSRANADGFAFDLVMCNCEPATAATTIRSLMENPPDGVILIGTELREADYELFKLFTVPFVVLDNNILLENVDSVVMANRELTAQLVRYLYSLGHREIQYYKFTQPVNNCDERYEGYLQELHRLGLEPPEPIMLKPTVDGAFEDMKRLIKGGEYVPHGAAIADNDNRRHRRDWRYSGGRVFHSRGYFHRRYFDDIPFSAVTMPALTDNAHFPIPDGHTGGGSDPQTHQESGLAGHAHAHRRQADRSQQHPRWID